MSVREEIKAMVEELAYLDHSHDTDVSSELLNAIGVIREDGLNEEEAADLLNDRLEMMIEDSVLEDDEHIRVVKSVIERLPALLTA